MPRFVPACLVAAALLLSSGPAWAANEFCDKEILPLVQARQALTARLADIGKHSKAPGARDKFCGTLAEFIGNIKKTLTYMQTNKDFCGIPDEAIAGAKKGLAQNYSLRQKVCVAQAAPAQQQEPGQPHGGAVPKPPVDLKLE